MYTIIYRTKSDNRRVKMTVSAGYVDDTVSRLECLGHHVVKVNERIIGRREEA